METQIVHIMIDKDGIPRTITGHVKVKMIAQKHLIAKETVEDIATHYEISLSDVYAALSYYYDHQDYFEQKEREVQPLIEEAKRNSQALKERIKARIQDKENE